MVRRIWFIPALALMVGVVVGYGIAYELTRPSYRVIARWQSPPEVVYDSPKCLLIVEGARSVPHPLLLSVKQYYHVYVGGSCDKPGYGHWIDFEPCCYRDVEGDRFWRNAQVEWTTDGVTLTLERSAHRLFIPVRAFTGGR